MEQPLLNWIANFIWGIADDVLRDLYVRGKYRDVILPMMRYLIATHRTGSRGTSDGRPWGDAWQSAHWAGPPRS